MIFKKDILNDDVRLIKECSDQVVSIEKIIGYNTARNKTYEQHFNGPIPEYEHEIKYNDLGQIVYESFMETGMYMASTGCWFEYAYQDGKVINSNGYSDGRVTIWDSDEFIDDSEINTSFFGDSIYNYMSNGKLQSVIVNGSNGIHIHCQYNYGLVNELLAVSLSDKIDIKSENGSPKVLISDEMNVKTIVHYTYPNKNTLCIHRIHKGECKFKMTINITDDDVLKWVIKETATEKVLKEYDTSGNLTKVNNFQNPNLSQLIKYEFDSHDNWIKKSIYNELDGKCIETVKRKIEYYSDYFINEVDDIADSKI